MVFSWKLDNIDDRTWCILGAANKLSELEERMRRTEDSSKENKNALSQLISHTKNVERAVTMSQQVTNQVKEKPFENVNNFKGHAD